MLLGHSATNRQQHYFPCVPGAAVDARDQSGNTPLHVTLAGLAMGDQDMGLVSHSHGSCFAFCVSVCKEGDE